MATRGQRWAFWLEEELERRGWSRSDIVKRSRPKDNGRPIIDAPRVSEWLNKSEAPTNPDILRELARILGVRMSVVLNAAGWLPDDELDGQPVSLPMGVLEAIEQDEDLIEEAREHLLSQYELLRRLSERTDSNSTERASTPPTQRPLRAVARRRPPRDKNS